MFAILFVYVHMIHYLLNGMTMKNKVLILLMTAFLTVPMVSCDKDKDPEPQNQLAGTWTLQRSEMTVKLSDEATETIIRDYTSESDPSTIVLTSDGQITVKDWDEDEGDYVVTTGTYEIRDGKLFATVAGEVLPFNNGFDYSISGNVLTISGTDELFIEQLGIDAEVDLKIIANRM